MKFNHVVCGGTFDHLHGGHKKLLEECISYGKKVTVGVATRALSRHKAYIYSLESYSKRVSNVTQFHTALIPYKLHDIFGPTLVDSTIDAIFVTQDTLRGANIINKKRLQIGMKPLSIRVVPFVYDDNNEKISSERIRQGIIDREGRNYYKYLISKEKFLLPESLKGVLRKPLGRIIPSISLLSEQRLKKMRDSLATQGPLYWCAVGDMVAYELKKLKMEPLISVIDGLTQRKALNKSIVRSITEKDRSNAKNEKGTIQKEASIALKNIFSSYALGHNWAAKQLVIQGEEDLLTLVAILLAPLHSHVWYGQQEVGAVDVRVTEKMKGTVYNLLKQFD